MKVRVLRARHMMEVWLVKFQKEAKTIPGHRIIIVSGQLELQSQL